MSRPGYGNVIPEPIDALKHLWAPCDSTVVIYSPKGGHRIEIVNYPPGGGHRIEIVNHFSARMHGGSITMLRITQHGLIQLSEKDLNPLVGIPVSVYADYSFIPKAIRGLSILKDGEHILYERWCDMYIRAKEHHWERSLAIRACYWLSKGGECQVLSKHAWIFHDIP